MNQIGLSPESLPSLDELSESYPVAFSRALKQDLERQCENDD